MRKIDIILYIVAGVLLVLPYSIMMLSKKLEMYPAIILPDGSSTAYYDDEYIRYSKIELIGKDKNNGVAKAIDSDLFFHPISSNRIYGFVNTSFGIEDHRRDTFRFRRNIISPIITNKKYNKDVSKDLNSWYRSKLLAQGLNDSIFIFQEEEVIIDRRTSAIIDSTLSRSKTYRLYD